MGDDFNPIRPGDFVYVGNELRRVRGVSYKGKELDFVVAVSLDGIGITTIKPQNYDANPYEGRQIIDIYRELPEDQRNAITKQDLDARVWGEFTRKGAARKR